MQLAFGSGLIWGTPLTDANGNTIAVPTPIYLGVLQDCSVNIDADTKQLYGQQQFAVDIARGKAKISVKAKAAQILARAVNGLFLGQTQTTGSTKVFNDLAGTVIPATPFTITPTPPAGGTYASDLGVRDQFGVPYVRVATGPTAGQYSLSAGVYTFAAADTGKRVFISYRYTLTTGQTLTSNNLLMGAIPTFVCDLAIDYQGRQTYFNFPQAVCGKFMVGTKQDDYTIPEYEMECFANGAGLAYTMSTAE